MLERIAEVVIMISFAIALFIFVLAHLTLFGVFNEEFFDVIRYALIAVGDIVVVCACYFVYLQYRR